MWKKVVKIAIVVLALVVVALGLYVRRMMPKFPEQPFVQPSGPYAVGTREYSWTDSSRAEPYTKDPSDHRRGVVQVWYRRRRYDAFGLCPRCRGERTPRDTCCGRMSSRAGRVVVPPASRRPTPC